MGQIQARFADSDHDGRRLSVTRISGKTISGQVESLFPELFQTFDDFTLQLGGCLNALIRVAS